MKDSVHKRCRGITVRSRSTPIGRHIILIDWPVPVTSTRYALSLLVVVIQVNIRDGQEAAGQRFR